MYTEMMNYTIKEISLSDIIFPANELRSKLSFEDLDELARSIRLVGLMNPITARPIGDKYELIAGYRRVKACEIANLATVSCRIVDSDDNIADLQRLHENMFREAVNPVDEGTFFKKMLIKNDWRIIDLSVQIHKSPSYVSRRLQLLDADPMIVNALQDQQINISVADELNRIDDADSRHRLLFYAINSGATVDTVRTWRIQYETDKTYIPPAPNIQSPEQHETNIEPAFVPARPGEEPPTTKTLHETVVETRPCFACLNKIDIENIRNLFFCTDCLAIVEAAIRPKEKMEVINSEDAQGEPKGE